MWATGYKSLYYRPQGSYMPLPTLTIIIEDGNSSGIPTRYKWGWCCYIASNNKVLCPFQELVIMNIDNKNLDIAIISALVKCHICIKC